MKKTKKPTKFVPKATPKAAPKGTHPAGPKTPKKVKDVNEGLGTVRIPLSDAEIAARGIKLARKLNEREVEVAAQSSAKKLMTARLTDIDDEVHRLSTAINEKIEERPAPGLFEDKAVGEDTMAKIPDEADEAEKGYPKCERKGCGHKFSEHEKVTVAGATPGQTICKRNGTTLACRCESYKAEPKAETTEKQAEVPQ